MRQKLILKTMEKDIMYRIKVFILFLLIMLITNQLLAFNLTESCICEQLINGKPQYKAVVFSVSNKKIYCYTYFEDIKKETFIYHIWYFKDKLVTKIKLKLKPPQWATFTQTFLREADIGPWRVEIVDDEGNIIDVLRFSVVE